MRWIRIARARLRAWFRHDVVAEEIREELDFHVDMRAKEYAREGLAPEDARRQAARRVGNLAVLQDQGYDVRGGGFVESIAQDVRYGVRALRNSPTFTIVALTVLALAIGASTAIFSVVDAVFLRGLPYDEHDRLAAVYSVDPKQTLPGFFDRRVTTQTYLDWRRLQQSFSELALANNQTFQTTTASGERRSIAAFRVTAEFFSVLRAKPLLGRLLTPDDERSDRTRVVILSYEFWQRHFGGALDVIGRTLQLTGETWYVVGVLPSGFSYPPGTDRPTELFVPRVFSQADKVRGQSREHNLAAVGRLRPGVSFDAAEGQMNRIAAALDDQYPSWEPGWQVRVVQLHEHLVGRTRSWMLLLLGSVALVLLIACANVANLMLARIIVRGREIGVRTALGAGRGRLVCALLIEGLLISVTAGLIGIVLAYGGVQFLRAWLPVDVPRVAAIAIDFRVLWVGISASILTGILFGAAPALQASRTDWTRALKEGDRSATSGTATRRVRNVLVVTEIALSVVLLTGAGLFAGSFFQLLRVDPGFDYRNTLVLRVSVPYDPAQSVDWSARGKVLIEQASDALMTVPGVTAVAASTAGLPLTQSWSRMSVSLPGRERPTGDDAFILSTGVSDGYFAQLRIPLVDGRFSSDEDRDGAPPVIIVNETAARKYWPGRSPIGEKLGGRTVIGVVGDIRQYGPEQPPRQAAFTPIAQSFSPNAHLLIRTAGDPLELLPAAKAAIWSVNPSQHFSEDVVTLEGHMNRLLAPQRFNMALMAILGIMALVIAAAGMFGVMAYVVAQRTNEFGVRIALGATSRQIVSMVLKGAAGLIACGLAIGAVAAWYLSSFAEAFLFQVQPTDPRVFAAALILLALAGLTAAAIPARRAAAVDPLVSLRES
jgi:putative ABC transport system permease protein